MEGMCPMKDSVLETYKDSALQTYKNGSENGDYSSIGRKSKTSSSGLAWKDLWVTVKSKGQRSRVVLQGLTGCAEQGKILAVMGPSGSGKSTLLDALAGRLGRHARMTGEISPLNGSNKKGLSSGRSIAYVTQDDTLIGTLTVRETIMYSANLRLSGGPTSKKKIELVEKAILEMGLGESANTPVGNWHLRGLSGGEKRRLSIALEILTRPELLFLDEPTSGLDSASAFFVIATLRRLARDGGQTLIASIHQPSSEVFALFDSLCLISNGRTVYFGDRTLAEQHFSDAGYPCPPRRNPSDHYLCAINSDFDKVKSSFSTDLESSYPIEQISSTEMTNILVEAYSLSNFAHAARLRADEMLAQQQQQKRCRAKTSNASSAGFFSQTLALTRRSFVNMRRDMGYYWLRLAIYIMLTLCIGTIYFKVGTSYQAIMARASCMSYITGFLTFMSIGGFPSFVEDMKVFSREHLNGHYGVLPFVLANFLSSLPFLALISIVSGSICYFMVELHPGFSHFAYFIMSLLTCLCVVESLMMAVASLVPNFLMGIITGAGIQGIFMLVAGFFRLPNDMPKPMWRYPMSFLSFHMYALQGMYQNDFLGVNFQSTTLPGPSIPGRFILKNMYQIDLSRSKWWDLFVLIAMVVGYRLLFVVMIKLSEVIPKHLSSASPASLMRLKSSYAESEAEGKRQPCSPTSSSCRSSSPTSSSSSSPPWPVIPFAVSSQSSSSPGPNAPLTSSSSVSSASGSPSLLKNLFLQALELFRGTKTAVILRSQICTKPTSPTSTINSSASSLFLLRNSSLNALP
ncbi:hypothetical protein KP509_21G046300 [Ceratopteris richardii]|uniref:ABC transporter domain-containing protein n=1 Tax=Ceratopteris richardii TaxID=49495 RepID=A0A8T2S9Y5_CERRI|nr:hypothetical protein KP509_21G046300 [Ceratopteris richardii]